MLISERWSRLFTILNILALAIIFTYGAKDLAIPAIAEMIYKEDYKDLALQTKDIILEDIEDAPLRTSQLEINNTKEY